MKQYDVLNPWAETDPIPLRGISPRPKDLNDLKIGLFYNNKDVGRRLLQVIEEKLSKRFPSSGISWYVPRKRYRYNFVQIETEENKEVFEEWLKGVDVVVATIGD